MWSVKVRQLSNIIVARIGPLRPIPSALARRPAPALRVRLRVAVARPIAAVVVRDVRLFVVHEPRHWRRGKAAGLVSAEILLCRRPAAVARREDALSGRLSS